MRGFPAPKFRGRAPAYKYKGWTLRSEAPPVILTSMGDLHRRDGTEDPVDRQINHFTTSYTTRGSSRVKRFNRRRSQLPPSIKCFMRTAAGTKTRASSHGSRETPGNGWRDFCGHAYAATPRSLGGGGGGGGGARPLEAPVKLAHHQQRPGPSMTEGFLVILIRASCSTPSSI